MFVQGHGFYVIIKMILELTCIRILSLILLYQFLCFQTLRQHPLPLPLSHLFQLLLPLHMIKQYLVFLHERVFPGFELRHQRVMYPRRAFFGEDALHVLGGSDAFHDVLGAVDACP